MRLPTLLAFVAIPTLVAAAACSSPTETSGFTTKDGGSTPSDDSGVVIPPTDGDGGGIGTQDAGLEACAKGKTGTRRVPAYLQLVLDGSGSMGFLEGKPWAAMVQAVTKVVGKWQTPYDPTLGVGISVFEDKLDVTGGDGPYPAISPGVSGGRDLKIQVVTSSHATALKKRVIDSGPSGLTPSYEALSGNYPYVKAFAPPAGGPLPSGGKKIVVFMSDGAPSDCGSTPYTKCTNLAAQYAADGVTTFAVLFTDGSSDTLRSFMNNMAYKGKGFAKPNCDPTSSSATKYCHFEVNINQNVDAIANAFVAAIEQARNSIDPCTLAIEKQAGQDFDPTLVNVTVTDGNGNKTTVPQDPANGWTFDDPANPQNVIVHGTTCDTVKTDKNASVELILGCPTITR